MPARRRCARAFFEQNFRGFRISPLGEREGFITGYYEPIVEGARLPSDIYTVPLYRRPPDLLLSRLRQQRAPKGKAAWRTPRKKTAPYFDRAQIEDGAIAGRGLEICYLKDPSRRLFRADAGLNPGATGRRLDAAVKFRRRQRSFLTSPSDAFSSSARSCREEMSMQRSP